ncbi:hypothetical protein AWC38_SpisGene12290 [Stylophora pistillata]|uniref:Uncharacterized protein n=1 Tax=Stylophora pistillata TaxID=50429 RepID=A0A2B4S3L0_STYPI|nr:hypothetical protein AWC38_SpisGene12290 [Stylophora pistillata]
MIQKQCLKTKSLLYFDVSSSLSEAKSNEFPLTSRFCRPEVQKRPMAKPTSDGLGRGRKKIHQCWSRNFDVG